MPSTHKNNNEFARAKNPFENESLQYASVFNQITNNNKNQIRQSSIDKLEQAGLDQLELPNFENKLKHKTGLSLKLPSASNLVVGQKINLNPYESPTANQHSKNQRLVSRGYEKFPSPIVSPYTDETPPQILPRKSRSSHLVVAPESPPSYFASNYTSDVVEEQPQRQEKPHKDRRSRDSKTVSSNKHKEKHSSSSSRKSSSKHRKDQDKKSKNEDYAKVSESLDLKRVSFDMLKKLASAKQVISKPEKSKKRSSEDSNYGTSSFAKEPSDFSSDDSTETGRNKKEKQKLLDKSSRTSSNSRNSTQPDLSSSSSDSGNFSEDQKRNKKKKKDKRRSKSSKSPSTPIYRKNPNLNDTNMTASTCQRENMTVVEYANTTTFHGCSNFLVDGPCTLRQLFWSWIFIGALSYCSYSAWKRVVYFFSYQHTTKIDEIDLQEEKSDTPATPQLDETIQVYSLKNDPGANVTFNSVDLDDTRRQMTFPAITICNLNMFKVQFLTPTDWKETAHHLFDIIDSNGDFILPEPVTNFFSGSALTNLMQGVYAFRNQTGRRRARSKRATKFVKPSGVAPTVVRRRKLVKHLQYPKIQGWNMVDFVNRTGFTLQDLVLEWVGG